MPKASAPLDVDRCLEECTACFDQLSHQEQRYGAALAQHLATDEGRGLCGQAVQG